MLRLAISAFGALCAVRCSDPVGSTRPPASVMLGEWSYTSVLPVPDQPSLNAGLQVTLAIDSADGMAFQGRVTRWFAGDVGISLDVFGPVTGSVDRSGGFALVFALTPTDLQPIAVSGALGRDVLTISDSWEGTEPGPFPPGGSFLRVRRANALP